jgi:hypothetical protein
MRRRRGEANLRQTQDLRSSLQNSSANTYANLVAIE